MDVITAYLFGKLDVEIYTVQPERFVRAGMKMNLVCRFLRPLYGVWNQKIHELGSLYRALTPAFISTQNQTSC